MSDWEIEPDEQSIVNLDYAGKTKILRTICTLAWFSYSFRYLSAYFYNTGLFGESPVPSLLNWIWELTSRASGAHALHEL